MRVEAGKDTEAKYYQVKDDTGRNITGCVHAFDTDRLCLDVFVMAGSKCLFSNGKAVMARVVMNYDVYDRRTGELIHRVRVKS